MFFKNTPACLGLEVDLFFTPDDGTSTYAHLDQIKRMCSSCPAKQECFEYAIEHAVQGIWSGTTFNERDLYRSKHGIVAKPVIPISLVRDHIYSEEVSSSV
jgi:WhiB family redox-sensing transcriptional regulator